jgi:cell division septum initiation protein DivIVA
MSPAQIRDASLPKSLRGFDEEATRKLLSRVAETVQTLMDQLDKLQLSLDEAKEARVDPEDPIVLGNVLLAAQRAGEDLIAHARATAAQITGEAQEKSERLLEETQRSAAEAARKLEERRKAYEVEHARLRDGLDESRAKLEAERRSVLAEARSAADRAAAEGRERLEALQREEETLRQLIADRRNEFAGMLQSALGRLEEGEDGEHELTADLKARLADSSSNEPA